VLAFRYNADPAQTGVFADATNSKLGYTTVFTTKLVLEQPFEETVNEYAPEFKGVAENIVSRLKEEVNPFTREASV
jgi:hypothetical protein